MLTPSHFLTYPRRGPKIGSVLGPSADGETYWVVVDNTPKDGKVVTGLYAIDSPDAAAEVAEWRASLN